MIERLFDHGHAADIVLGVLVLEAIWLITRGYSARRVLYALGPGALMVIAIRFALTGAAWPWIAAALAASLPLHLLDMARRGRLGPRRHPLTSSSDTRSDRRASVDR